jgi:hypothetical protein
MADFCLCCQIGLHFRVPDGLGLSLRWCKAMGEVATNSGVLAVFLIGFQLVSCSNPSFALILDVVRHLRIA